MKKLVLITPLLLSLACIEAHAGGGKNKSFTANTSRTNAHGTHVRQIQQQATAKGFQRNRTVTLANGKTKTVDKTVTRNPETGNRNAQRVVTGFNGQTRNRMSETQRTETGYQQHTSMTNGQGQTISRAVDNQVDRESGTQVKTITRTNALGENTTRTVERNFEQYGDE